MAPRLERASLPGLPPWMCMVGEVQQPEGKETTAGISERCHFSFVCCQGLLTSAGWVTGVNLSWAEGRVSSSEVEAVPAHWHPCPCPCPSPESAMYLQTLALLLCFRVCRTCTPHSMSSHALRCSAGGWDGMVWNDMEAASPVTFRPGMQWGI